MAKLPGNSVEKHPRCGGRKQSGNPIAETRRKTATLVEVKNVDPTNRIKGLPNVKLEEKSQDLGFVESSGNVLHIEEVVMSASLLNKSTLRFVDKVIHKWTKTGS
jgi:hypothetical protein